GPIVDLVGTQYVADGLDFLVGIAGPGRKRSIEHGLYACVEECREGCAEAGPSSPEAGGHWRGRERAGVPTATIASATSRTTVAPLPMVLSLPMWIRWLTLAPRPIQLRRPICTPPPRPALGPTWTKSSSTQSCSTVHPEFSITPAPICAPALTMARAKTAHPAPRLA